MKPQQECFDAYGFPGVIITVRKGHPCTPEFDLIAKELQGVKGRIWRRQVKNECQHYLKTSISGSYETAGIVDTMLDNTLVPLFEDTELIEQPDSVCLERHMEIAGKKFTVSSVFPKAAVSLPTDKLLSLIDKELEAERSWKQRLILSKLNFRHERFLIYFQEFSRLQADSSVCLGLRRNPQP